MRVWHIDPGYLDNKRLYAQNNEIHALHSCVKKGIHWGSISLPFEKCMPYAKGVHDAVAKEMALRQRLESKPVKEHASAFLLEDLPPEAVSCSFELTELLYRKDTLDLRTKWEAEGYYFGAGRLDLCVMERRLEILEGQSLDRVSQIKEQTRKLFAENKHRVPDKYPRMQDKIKFLRSLEHYV